MLNAESFGSSLSPDALKRSVDECLQKGISPYEVLMQVAGTMMLADDDAFIGGLDKQTHDHVRASQEAVEEQLLLRLTQQELYNYFCFAEGPDSSQFSRVTRGYLHHRLNVMNLKVFLHLSRAERYSPKKE